MNFVTKFFKAIGGFFSSSVTPDKLAKISAVSEALSPLVANIVQVAAGTEDAATVMEVSKEVNASLLAVSNLVKSYQAGAVNGNDFKTQLRAALSAIVSNLNALLAVGHIKNEQTKTTITLLVNSAVAIVNTVLALL